MAYRHYFWSPERETYIPQPGPPPLSARLRRGPPGGPSPEAAAARSFLEGQLERLKRELLFIQSAPPNRADIYGYRRFLVGGIEPKIAELEKYLKAPVESLPGVVKHLQQKWGSAQAVGLPAIKGAPAGAPASPAAAAVEQDVLRRMMGGADPATRERAEHQRQLELLAAQQGPQVSPLELQKLKGAQEMERLTREMAATEKMRERELAAAERLKDIELRAAAEQARLGREHAAGLLEKEYGLKGAQQERELDVTERMHREESRYKRMDALANTLKAITDLVRTGAIVVQTGSEEEKEILDMISRIRQELSGLSGPLNPEAEVGRDIQQGVLNYYPWLGGTAVPTR